MKRKFLTLFLILLTTIIAGCQTKVITIKYVLPATPVRKAITKPVTIKDWAIMVNYYEGLVREWEVWGKTVEDTVSVE